MKKITKLAALSLVGLLAACGAKYTKLDADAIKELIEAIPEDVDLQIKGARQVLTITNHETVVFYEGYEEEFAAENEGNAPDYYASEKVNTYINKKYNNRVVENYSKETWIYLDDPETDYGEGETVELKYCTEDEDEGEMLNWAYHYPEHPDDDYGMALPIYFYYDSFDEFLAECNYGYSHDSVENFFCKDEEEGYTTKASGKKFSEGNWEATYTYEFTFKWSEYVEIPEEDAAQLEFNPDIKEIGTYYTKFENGACVYAENSDAYYISNSPVDGKSFGSEKLFYKATLVTDEFLLDCGDYIGEYYPCDPLF